MNVYPCLSIRVTVISLLQVTDFEPTSFYGLGLTSWDYKNHLNYNHSGAMMGYTSFMLYDVRSQAVFCVLMNDNETNFANRVIPLLDVFYDEHPKKTNDAGITVIRQPWGNSCNTSFSPLVWLTNYGSDPLHSVDIKYRVDQGSYSTFGWNGTLNSGDTVEVSLPAISIGTGSHTLTCFTSLPNGFPDGFAYNDTAKSIFTINDLPSMISVISESFEGDEFPPLGWVENYSNRFQWSKTSLGSFSGSRSAVRSNTVDDIIGNVYDLDLPMIQINDGTHPDLDFEYAYRKYGGMFVSDTLQVLISTDCGATWQELFNKGGLDLQTSSFGNYPFYPQSSAEWKHENISLASYSGNALIRFRCINGSGNDLYLDDVSVSYPPYIGNEPAKQGIAIYPNPAKTGITIEAPVNSHFSILNLAGQELFSGQFKESRTRLDVSTLPGGVYMVRVVDESGIEVGKFIKE